MTAIPTQKLMSSRTASPPAAMLVRSVRRQLDSDYGALSIADGAFVFLGRCSKKRQSRIGLERRASPKKITPAIAGVEWVRVVCMTLGRSDLRTQGCCIEPLASGWRKGTNGQAFWTGVLLRRGRWLIANRREAVPNSETDTPAYNSPRKPRIRLCQSFIGTRPGQVICAAGTRLPRLETTYWPVGQSSSEACMSVDRARAPAVFSANHSGPLTVTPARRTSVAPVLGKRA